VKSFQELKHFSHNSLGLYEFYDFEVYREGLYVRIKKSGFLNSYKIQSNLRYNTYFQFINAKLNLKHDYP
jgi:hypothetical protein